MAFKPDPAGFRAVLNSSGTRAAIHALAEDVASEVRATLPDEDIVVDDYTTDRAASSVTIREPDALLHQARDGVLTRAAAAKGLEVVERP